MEFRINRESVSVQETLYHGTQEQSVELDYLLPDYYPDLFKLLSCTLTPSVLQFHITGDKLTYELRTEICIWYCSEHSSVIQCIRRHVDESKVVMLEQTAETMQAVLQPHAESVTCRLANPRRIDVRGVVSVGIHVSGTGVQDAVCDAFGNQIQTKKVPVSFPSKTLHAVRDFLLTDEAELTAGKPDILHVLRACAQIRQQDSKIIAGKLVAKGEAEVQLLYATESGADTLRFTTPYSQIVDLEGIDEGFDCEIRPECISCEARASGSDGALRTLQCEINIRLFCTAVQTSHTTLVTDAYSTIYPCECSWTPIRFMQPPIPLHESFQTNTKLRNGTGALTQIYDAWCSVKRCSTQILPNAVTLSGQLLCCVLGQEENGASVLLEQEETFSLPLTLPENQQADFAEPQVTVTACSFSMNGADGVTVQTELTVTGCIRTTAEFRAVTELAVDASARKQRDGTYAVKLYFATEGEDIWEIAKRCSASMESIMEENGLSEECLTRSGMLLIPIETQPAAIASGSQGKAAFDGRETYK